MRQTVTPPRMTPVSRQQPLRFAASRSRHVLSAVFCAAPVLLLLFVQSGPSAQVRPKAAPNTKTVAAQPPKRAKISSLPIRERQVVARLWGKSPLELHIDVGYPNLAKLLFTASFFVLLGRLRLHRGFEADFAHAVLFKRSQTRAAAAFQRLGARKVVLLGLLRSALWLLVLRVEPLPRAFNQPVLFRDDALPNDPTCKKGLSEAQERRNLLFTARACTRVEAAGEFFAVYTDESAHSLDGSRHVCLGGSAGRRAVGRVRVRQGIPRHLRRSSLFDFPLDHFRRFCTSSGVNCTGLARIASRDGQTFFHGQRLGEGVTLETSNHARPGFNVLRETVVAVMRGESMRTATRNALAAHAQLGISSCYSRGSEIGRESVLKEKLVVSVALLSGVILVELIVEWGSEVDFGDVFEGTFG